ncbi:MAG: acetyl-CoA carboxylase biotin carboxyl carrier protein [Alphaproteobacteria bacterium]
MARNDKKTPPPEPDIDARAIRDLARLLDETGLSEIEVEQGGKRIKVVRQLTLHATPIAPPGAATTLRAPIVPPIEAEAPVVKDLAKHPGAVTSPMVGTAFLAPEPTADPFVKAGDTVTKGQTLLIIDAMKTMNPIPSPKAGKVIEVLVSNGAPVEFGQALMIIE